MSFLTDPSKPLVYTGNWSFSSLMTYESCAYRFALARIHRLPEKPRPPDNPLERGNRIHDHLEKFVKSETDSLAGIEAKKISEFEDALVHARELYRVDMATAEQDWIFNRDWDQVDRKDPEKFLWAKLDMSVTDEAQSLVISIDYKSGKSQYKMIEHVQQLQLYTAISALKYPWADFHRAELWYVDEGWVKAAETPRDRALSFVGRFEKRANKIYEDRLFKPNPTVDTCRYCPYGPRNGTGACPVGV